MIFGRIRAEQKVSFFSADLCIDNGAAQEDQRGHGVGKRVMPAERGESFAKVVFQAEIPDQIAERKRRLFRPDSSGKLESIHPWSKTVKRERAQEPALGSGPVGDEPAIVQEAVDPGPELGQAGGAGKILCPDAVDFLRCPGDRLFGKKEAFKIFRDLELMHQRDANLHGHFGASAANAGAFKIDCRERNLGNSHAARPNTARRSFGSGISRDLEMVLGLKAGEQFPGRLPIDASVGDRDAILQCHGIIAQRLTAKIQMTLEHSTNDFAAS
jgi:hypothetical protein